MVSILVVVIIVIAVPSLCKKTVKARAAELLRWKYLAFETEICNYYDSLATDRLKNVWG